MNESIRLNKTEIDTIVMGLAYNLTSRTLAYNKARVTSVSLSRTPAALIEPPTPPSDPNAEQSEDEAARGVSRATLTKALTEIHTRCKEDLETFPKKLALAVGIQSRLLTALKSPTGTANVTFTADECESVIEALRTFEEAEVDPITTAELVIAHILRNYDGDTIVTESARQTKEEIAANKTRRDDFICLMAKVITYSKTQTPSTGNTGNTSDQ